MIVAVVVALVLAVAPDRDPQAVAGEAAFAEGRWDDASAAFDAAWRSTSDPAFLYARAQAERRAGRCKVAIVLYEQFVAAGVGDEGRAAAEQYIAECRATLPVEPPPPVLIERPPVDTPPPPPPPRPWHRDPLAAVLVAGGGVGVVAGAVTLALAYRTADRADGAADDRGYADRFASASRLEIGGAVATSVGAALLTGGIVRWIVLARRNR